MTVYQQLDASIAKHDLEGLVTSRELYSMVRDMTDGTDLDDFRAASIIDRWMTEAPGEHFPQNFEDAARVVANYDRPRAYVTLLVCAARERRGTK